MAKEIIMRLNDRELKNKAQWEKAGIQLPKFDRETMLSATKNSPKWVHFGAGNIFRAFPAALSQTLLEQGLENTGIVAAEGYDGEIIDKCFTPFDNLCLLVTLKSNGTTEKKVIGSIASSHRIDNDITALKQVFASPSLQMASFTITEKGYSLTDRDGALMPEIAGDMQNGPAMPKSYLGRIAALVHERFVNGELPLAMVSMDNCSHNGDRLFSAMEAFAKGWVENGVTNESFLGYIRNKKKLSFPWSMIDKITPRPDESVRNMLAGLGLENVQDIITGKNTYTAPFVNAEETQYLVIEDDFPNGRPPLEKTGVLFAGKETVDMVEKMKVCACLNPLHTALAVFGCLLGYTRISEEMKNPDLVKLIEGIGYREGLPVAADPGVIKPRDFIDKVIKVRLPNPFMPDAPQRIATDSSQKIPIRFGETIKAYLEGRFAAGVSGLTIDNLVLIPLVIAAWLRYLLGVDDNGRQFEVSSDPLYPSLKQTLAGISLGQKGPFHETLKPVLSDSKLFGVNLYEAGLGEKVESYFAELLAGPGAVAAALRKYVNKKTIWFATGNAHKKTELSAILRTHGVDCRLLIPKDAGLDFDPEETGTSFHENALLKAGVLYALLDKNRPPLFSPGDPVIADDSGICVDALDGRPGIYSARYAGAMSKGYTKKLEAAQRNALLLEELGDAANRKARFVCAIVLLYDPNRFFTARETMEGEIVRNMERAKGAGGFGYDPVFFIPQLGRTAAELSEEEKNMISHRGKAGKIIAGIITNLK
jgi:fructuronate reductase